MVNIGKDIVWVRFTYSDGSQICFQSTLNPEILNNLKIKLLPNCLPRLDRQYYINKELKYHQFELTDDILIEYLETPVYTNEVSEQLKDYI